MKIIFAPKAAVENAWNRLQPQQRFFGEIGPCSVKLPWEDAVLVPIGTEVKFGIFDKVPEETTVKQLREMIENGEYQEMELKPAQ
jgi:hypothetical protein